MKINREVLVFVAVLGLSPAGCATLERSGVIEQTDRLKAAGFREQPADTPEKLALLGSMPAHKVVTRVEHGESVYSYADPDYCRCLYVGGPQEYSTYERLFKQAEDAEFQNSAR